MAFFLAFLRLLFHSHIYFFGILLLNIHASSFKACFACFPKVLIGGEVGNSWLAASAMEKCGSLGEPPWQWIFAPWTQNFDWSKLKESWQRCSSGCFVLYEFLMILVRLWLLAWFWLDRSWRILDSVPVTSKTDSNDWNQIKRLGRTPPVSISREKLRHPLTFIYDNLCQSNTRIKLGMHPLQSKIFKLNII